MENKRNLLRPGERIREKWKEKMLTNMVEKIDLDRDLKFFEKRDGKVDG